MIVPEASAEPLAPLTTAEEPLAQEPLAQEALAQRPDGAAPVSSRAVLLAGDAHLLAWAALAASNALIIALTRLPPRGIPVRVLHHTYDASQMLAVGFFAESAIAAFRRLAPRSPVAGYLALALASAAVGTQTLDEDLRGPATSLARRGGGEDAWLFGLIVLVSLGIPLAAWLGRRMARPRLRWVAVAIAIAAAFTNQFILQNTYPGAHLYLAAFAATLGGAALTGATWQPRRARSQAEQRAQRRWILAGRAVLCLLGAASLVVWPPQSVVLELYKVQGSVVMPLLARRRAQSEEAAAVIPQEARAWFVERSGVPDIPPSSPKLLENGIVILITIDSLRADVLNNPEVRHRFARLNALIEGGVYFTDVRAPGASTLNSLASVFAGKYASQLQYTVIPKMGYNPSQDPSVRFPEALARANIPTFTAVSYPQLQGSYGVARGFTEEIVLKPERGQKFPLSAQSVEVAIQRLERKDAEGPLFLFLHFMDPHAPYDAAGAQGPDFERYLREIALCDASIGALLGALGKGGLLRRAALIISADHGEAFGQHNTPTHGGTLYEELVRVPLILHVPGTPARRVDTPVSLMDIGPTVLDLMGLPTPGSYMGQSLTPYLRGETPVLTRPIVSDTARIRAMVMGDHKVIEDDTRGSQEIYDLRRDPGELDNLFDAMGEEGARQRFAVLHTFFRAHRASNRAPARRRAE